MFQNENYGFTERHLPRTIMESQLTHKEVLIRNILNDGSDSSVHGDERMLDDNKWTVIRENSSLNYQSLLCLLITVTTGTDFTDRTSNKKSGGKNKCNTGKRFKDIAIGSYYIPHPTNGKDFGLNGKGTGPYKLLVRNEINGWDIFVLGITSTNASAMFDPEAIERTAKRIAEGFARADASRKNT